MRPTRPIAALAVVCLFALVGCGDDDGDDAGEGIGLSPESTTSELDTTTSSSDDAASDPSTTTAAAGTSDTTSSAAPVRGCETYSETDDGVYQVFDAGEIEISRDGDTITLVEARPADGWTATDDLEDDADEIEVDFRRGNEEIEVEAEVDDGVMEVEVCND